MLRPVEMENILGRAESLSKNFGQLGWLIKKIFQLKSFKTSKNTK